MKIPTIKKLFSKTDSVAKKGVIAVATVMAAPKKMSAKKAVTKAVSAKKMVVSSKAPTPVKTIKKTVAKKATLSPATKQSVVKKVSPKKIVNSVKLVVASDSQSFWIQDGQILNSLPALEAALSRMSATLYTYHAMTDGNHFADWVELVLGDKACATALRKAKTAKAAGLVVKKHLASLA